MSFLRRVIAGLYRRCRRLIGKPLPPPPIDEHRDYQRTWVDPAGKAYRMAVYERQHANGTKPLHSNPQPEEIAAILRREGVRRVLEIGCGWGRLATALASEFDVSGCDVSDDMLRLCPPELRAFHLDVAVENADFVRTNTGAWDALFTRGVMLYIVSDPTRLACALRTMLTLARGNVHCWEWPEVCDQLRRACTDPRLVLHPMAHLNE